MSGTARPRDGAPTGKTMPGALSAAAMNRLAAICVLGAGVFMAGAVLLRLAERPEFRLRQIEVRGDLRHVSEASVRAALAGRLRGSYFTLPLDDARRVFEQVPWVARASVRRVWPNGLRVVLTEHRALGVWQDGRLLSDRGELFVANPDEAELYGALPEFDGPPQAAPEAARRYYELAAQFAALSLRIEAIDISNRNGWSLRVSDDAPMPAGGPPVRVELGRVGPTTPLAERVAQVIAAYPLITAQAGAPPTRIDARYANGLAAAWPAAAARAMRTERVSR